MRTMCNKNDEYKPQGWEDELERGRNVSDEIDLKMERSKRDLDNMVRIYNRIYKLRRGGNIVRVRI